MLRWKILSESKNILVKIVISKYLTRDGFRESEKLFLFILLEIYELVTNICLYQSRKDQCYYNYLDFNINLYVLGNCIVTTQTSKFTSFHQQKYYELITSWFFCFLLASSFLCSFLLVLMFLRSAQCLKFPPSDTLNTNHDKHYVLWNNIAFLMTSILTYSYTQQELINRYSKYTDWI